MSDVVLGLFSYGGVMESTVDSVINELSYGHSHGIAMKYHRISGDALIPRSRSRALGTFYRRQKPGDVMVMVDHDMAWRAGDLCKIATEAAESKSLVGGLYCKRTFGKGWSSRVNANGAVHFGQSGRLETDSLATGFLAIPWEVADKLIDELTFTGEKFQEKLNKAIEGGDHEEIRKLCDLSIQQIADGAWKKVEYNYWDFFRCIRTPSNVAENTDQFISEDWAFSMRCVHCGIKSYISTVPVLVHYGDYGYTIPDGMDKDALKVHNATQGNVKDTEGQIQRIGGAQK